MQEVLSVALAAARAGVAEARTHLANLAGLEFHEKETGKSVGADVVSLADASVEAVIRSSILTARPNDSVLGEEGGSTGSSAGLSWVVDPIDGTMNFAYGRAEFAISIAACDERGAVVGVVAQVTTGRVFHAVRGGGAFLDGVSISQSSCERLDRSIVDLGRGRNRTRAKFVAVLAALDSKVRDIRRGGCAALAACQVANGELDAMYGPGLEPWDITAGALIAAEAGASVIDVADDVVVIAASGVADQLVAVLTPVVGQ